MPNARALKLSTPNDLDIVMERVFDAPRQMVFDAYTKPELLKRWLLGPPGWEMVVCQVDNRVGGDFRYEWRFTDGKQFGIGGVCREFDPPRRIVRTECMDGCPGESLVTLELLEQDGKTTVITTARFDSQKSRDSALKSGMERGVNASYDRLDALLLSQPG
jgi:uncharacterized protein YndB with AHSA1/START domain